MEIMQFRMWCITELRMQTPTVAVTTVLLFTIIVPHASVVLLVAQTLTFSLLSSQAYVPGSNFGNAKSWRHLKCIPRSGHRYGPWSEINARTR